MRTPRVGSKWTFKAVWLDRYDRDVRGISQYPADGTPVVVVQPHGCPKNGTMGHCYVSEVSDPRSLCLVAIASLTREAKA